MSTLHACVLAAGKGTRMGGDRPKVLFEAGGKPLLEWVTDALSEAGARLIVAVVGHQKDDVIATLPTGVRWAEQSPQLGTGHAVRCARSSFQDVPADTLIVTCGDMPLIRAETYRELAAFREQEEADAVILTVPIDPESRFGRIVRDADGNVRHIVEYKDATAEERAIREGNAGVYAFRPETFWPTLDRLRNENAQEEYYLTDVIAILLGDGGTVRAVQSRHPGEELGVNTPDDLRQADEALRRRLA